MIREVHISDAPTILSIYNYYVEKTVITFDEKPLTMEQMERKIINISKEYPFIVLEENNTIYGYAYATQWKVKSAYDQSAEVTIYLDHNFKGKKLGTILFNELLIRLQNQGLHCLIGGITLPNDASIALHKKFGFKKVAEFEEIGFKFGKWLNVGYWEKIL